VLPTIGTKKLVELASQLAKKAGINRLIVVSKAELVELIRSRIDGESGKLTESFTNSAQQVGVRYTFIDDLLPTDLALSIAAAFPPVTNMRLMDSFREKKYTSKNFDQFDPILGDVTFAIQDPKVVAAVENITGIEDQVPDSLLYAGGLSAMAKGHFLNPHIDNSHDASRQYYRTLNLLYYVTPDWACENGGNLQLWDKKVHRSVTLHSKFNRLILMETNPSSWHSVNKVEVDKVRCCVSNYYFSRNSPTGQEYFNITGFSAPPRQPVMRLFSRVDAGIRQVVRKLKPDGLGKLDVYDGPPR
jgi:Rps23 Pro-64 3,4-dihydroxylase Tpa1-like proline 4-hydroxylase